MENSMSEQQLQSIVSNAVANALIAKGKDGVFKTTEQVLAQLKAENAKLKGNGSSKIAAAPIAAPPASATTAKADAKLLEIVHKFVSPSDKVKAGVVPGTFAVKVHGYFHACGVPEDRVREIIDSACKRNVISRMTIPTKNGRMMMYFDAAERPNVDRVSVPAAEKAALTEAFGF
jgi:hypothetical protein